MNNDDLSDLSNYLLDFNYIDYTYDFDSKTLEELVTEEMEKLVRAKDSEKSLIVNILDLLTKDRWLDVLDTIVVIDSPGLVPSYLYEYNDTTNTKTKIEDRTKEDDVENLYPYPNVYTLGLVEDNSNRVDFYAAFDKEYSPYRYHIYFNSGDIFGRLILLKSSHFDNYKMFMVTGIVNGTLMQNIQTVTLDFKGDFINDLDSLEYFKVEFGKLMSKVC